MRNQKYYIAIDENERQIVLNALNSLRNKLLAEGRYTDAVDDVLIKVVNAPVKKFKIRYTRGNKEIYEKRKETIERIFGTAKEMHGLRYTNMVGKARMEMKVGLTYLCMNLKKLAKMKERYGLLKPLREPLSCLLSELFTNIKIPGLGTLS